MNASPKPAPQAPSAGDYLIASKACELRSLEYFLQMGKLIQCISNLVHGLQRERGASNVFLGSSGQKFAAERKTLMAQADQQMVDFESALADIHQSLTGDAVSSRLLNQIASALHGLEGLAALRRRVTDRAATAAAATDEYSGLIQSLIAVVFEAADTAVDPTIAGLLVAMVHLMNGKELCGQERAVGSAGFSSGHFDKSLAHRMVHLAEAQERCFQVFTRFADSDSMAAWERMREHEREPAISRLRNLASSVGPYKSLDSALADEWFRLMTERIDALKEVEDSVEGGFHARCAERYADARSSLAHQENLIASLDTLDARESASQPVLVLCDASKEDATGDAYSGSGVGEQFGRSIFELVEAQALRLQQMNDELQEARTALEDRKTHEKAVALLMEHRGINNSEAHRVLRKLAMDQSKKLSEVARSVIDMADVLRK